MVFPGNGSPANCIFYVDGNNDGQSASSSNSINTVVTTSTNTHFAIGSLPTIGVNAYGLNAGIADLRIYNTPLSQSNILQLVYGAGTPPSITAPLTNLTAMLGDTNATVTFTVNVSGSGLAYYWQHQGTNLPAPVLPHLWSVQI